MLPRGTDAEGVGLPPLLKTRMQHVNRDGTLLDIAQAGGFEYLGQVSPVRPGEQRFVLSITVDHMHRVPEWRQRPGRPVPYAGGNDTPGSGHACHLSDGTDRVRHEMHHQLCQSSVEN